MLNKLGWATILGLWIAGSYGVSQDVDSSTVALAAQPVAIIAEDYVTIESGQLPIILSAPHGGNLNPPGVPARVGDGLEKGATGFFTGRDTGTEELAQEVASAIEKRFGKRPYIVASRVNRKYLDPNRPADIAFEHPTIEPVYTLYHDSLARFCREVTNRFRAGVLVDIHGQGSRSDTVFRGTKNGLTVTRLRAAATRRARVVDEPSLLPSAAARPLTCSGILATEPRCLPIH